MTEEQLLSPESSPWFAETKVRPGEALRTYREIHRMTQAILAAKLSGISVQKRQRNSQNFFVFPWSGSYRLDGERLKALRRGARDRKELDTVDSYADELNPEALDVLNYQHGV